MIAHLRPALSSDIDGLVAIEDRVFAHDRISRRSFRRLIARATADTRLAEVDGMIAGYSMVLYRRGTAVARLYSIAVDPAFGGMGVGRALLEEAERAACATGRLALRLEVREDNARAVALYRARGYREIGRVAGYYRDGMAAIRLEKPLRAAVTSGKRRP